MSWRPQPARWFEALIARQDLARALEALAEDGRVQIAHREELQGQDAPPRLAAGLRRYQQLAGRYTGIWPRRDIHPSSLRGRPRVILNQALAAIEAWQAEADPLIDELGATRSEHLGLAHLARLLALLRQAPLPPGYRLADLRRAGPQLRGMAFHLGDLAVPPASAGLLLRPLEDPDAGRYLLVLGRPEASAQLARELSARRAQPLQLPDWLQDGSDAEAEVQRRRDRLALRAEQLQQSLADCHQRHGLHQALGDIERLRWLSEQVRYLPISPNLVWVRGWTSARAAALQAVLGRGGGRGLVRLATAPAGLAPPMLLRNRRWVQPFELFTRLLGMPGAGEADPSPLLALVVPLLFGYMFGDLGQGAVLLLAGLALRRRWPPVRLLIPCGISAMAFGLAYGSLFAIEGLWPALWLQPLDQPLPLLAAPLAGGALLLLLGLGLHGLAAAWQGRARAWRLGEAALIPLYLGTLLWPWSTALGGGLLALGLGWAGYGAWRLGAGHRRGPALARTLGELLERWLQLLINTLSFARVGAFALAHAGLSLAVVSLAEGLGGVGYWPMLILGNLLILIIEGLVVAIQTTRLVLFEFFLRFFEGRGRPFRPLAPPDYVRSLTANLRS